MVIIFRSETLLRAIATERCGPVALGPRRAAQRKLLLEANRRPPSLVDVSRAVTATSGRRAVTAGRCVPQCRAPQLLHPARALGSPWRARVNDSSAARHRGDLA
jgi:hypothetical protein